VQSVLEKYPNSLNIYYAHLPLVSHEHAFKAAMATECVRNQGDFKNYDSLLFAYQNQLDSLSYVDLAREAGVKDLSIFSQCLENEDTKQIVDRGMELAQKLNISSIPTFIINGRVIPGALSEKSLIGIIEEELAKTK
jgi:protein-disulfide isomerase